MFDRIYTSNWEDYIKGFVYKYDALCVGISATIYLVEVHLYPGGSLLGAVS